MLPSGLHNHKDALPAAANMSHWVAPTRFKPAAPADGLIPRPALFQALRQAASARVILVQAPPGYGKSCALGQWFELLRAESVPCAWLSLDEREAEPGQFLTSLEAACQAANFFAAPPNSQAEAGRIAKALERCEGRHVLFLDDFHLAESALARQLLNTLPRALQWVFISRARPAGLGLASLRAQGECFVLPWEALKFSKKEVRAYLEADAKPDLPDRICAELAERTEGWPIALQAVRQWLRAGLKAEAALRRLTGRCAELAEYFMEQAFAGQPEETRRFLLQTAFLERLNGDAANEICGIADAWPLLESLERRGMFLACVDPNREWHRLHRLFAEFLEDRARRANIDLKRLRMAAAAWFGKRGHGAEALRYARLSGCSELTAQTLESLGGWQYAIQDNLPEVRAALDLVDAEALPRFPKVWLAKIYFDLKAGHPKRAERDFKSFSDQLRRQAAGEPAPESEVRIFRSMLSIYCDHELESGDAQASQLETLDGALSCNDDFLQAVRWNLLCVLHGQGGRLGQALKAGDQAIEHFQRFGSLYGEIAIHFHQGYLFHLQGRLRHAWLSLMQGCELAGKGFGKDGDLSMIGSVFLAQVAYQQNDCALASAFLESALPHVERSDAWLEVYVSAYATALGLAMAEQDEDRGREILNRAIATASQRGLPRLQQAMLAYFRDFQIKNAMQGKQPVEFGKLDLSGSQFHPLTSYYAERLRGREMLLNGQAEQAARHFARHAQALHSSGQIGHCISLRILQAIAQSGSGQREQALATFEEALMPAAAEGMRRPFLDEGEAALRLVEEVRISAGRSFDDRLRNSFLSDLLSEMDAAKSRSARASELLTQREQAILRLLAQGCSNPEIADLADVSVNTVKFHLKNLFAKLGVQSRKEVVSTLIRNPDLAANAGWADELGSEGRTPCA